MRLARFALFLAAGLAVSGSAAAHSELHSADWCTDGVIAYAGEFILSAEELQAESNSRQQAAVQRCLDETGLPPDPGGVGTCGIFDPPYELALSMARAVCGDRQSPFPSHGSPVVAVILEPQSFNEADHHTGFDLNAGLRGLCGICVIGPPAEKPRGQD